MRGDRAFLTEAEKKNRPKVTWKLIRRIGSYMLPYWKQMVLVLICICISSVLGLLPSILTGRIVDEGLIGRDLKALIILVVLSLAVTLGANLIGVLESYLNTWIAQHITYDMRNRMFRHLQTMGQRFFTSNNQGDIITRMTSDISGVESVVSDTLTSILTNIITLIVALVAMFRKNWILALLGMAIVPLFSVATKRMGKTRWALTREAQACHDEINGILNETLSVSGQLLVKLFTKEEVEARRYEGINKKLVRLNIRQSMAGRWFRVVMTTVTSIGPMLIYLVGGVLMMQYDHDLTVGDITVLVALLGKMYQPVGQLLNIRADWIRSMAMFTRIFEYFDMPAEITNAPGAVVPERAEGHVKFEHVEFSYLPEREILKDVSFNLESGKNIAVVGPSGAGKSSLVNLIPRLYDVTSGRILFDGVDVRQLDLEFLRKNVGVVTQDTYLFNDTIRNNLLYANPDATEEEIIQACKKANIHDFIMAQTDGYDTYVGNRGLKLSGGEKQRVSIARVLLKDPAVLIFDEATSSLDSVSESLIQGAIDPLISSRTSIVIAHRLSTVLNADEILVLQDGVVVERGKHAQLVEQEGVYRQLYETQFRKAIDEYEQSKES